MLEDFQTNAEDAPNGANFGDEEKKLKEVEAPIKRVIAECEDKCRSAKAEQRNLFGGVGADDYAAFMSAKSDSQLYERQTFEYKSYAEDPYFYHIDLHASNGDTKSFVVGMHPVTIDGKPVVVDWRTEMGGLYANKQDLEYTVKGKKYTPLLRRNVTIRKGALRDVNTEYDTAGDLPGEVVDSFLRKVMRDKRRSYKLQDIIVTIQEKQNEIMRRPASESFIVQGCAGSGKTMILLHRLSYLVNNPDNPDVDPDRFAVITPGDFFDKHIADLSARLDVSKIRSYDVGSFYNYLIGLLASSDTYEEEKDGKVTTRAKIPTPQSVNPTESSLEPALLSEAYSASFLGRIIDAANRRKQDALDKLKAEGAIEYFSELGLHVPTMDDTPYALYTFLQRSLQVIRNDYALDEDVVAVRQRELEAARSALADTRRRVEAVAERIDKARAAVLDALPEASDEVEFLIANSTEQEVQDAGLLEERQYLDKLAAAIDAKEIALPFYGGVLQTIRLEDSLTFYANMFNLLTPAEMSLATSGHERIDQRMQRVRAYEEALADATRNLENSRSHRLVGTVEECIQSLDARRFGELLEGLMRQTYKAHDVVYVPNRNYPHRIYARLALCVAYYGQAMTGLRHISIDEAQDISPTEYEVLRAALGPRVTYNLYGDSGQLVCDYRGTDDWGQIEPELQARTFSLEQNYRNTLQITSYCNQRFNKQMTGIGLEGAVVQSGSLAIGVSNLMKLRRQHPNMRLAVIHDRDFKMVNKLLEPLLGGAACWGEVDESKVSVIDVVQSKGLEFDGALVIENLMLDNELYVACTRALDNLFVCRVEEKVPAKPSKKRGEGSASKVTKKSAGKGSAQQGPKERVALVSLREIAAAIYEQRGIAANVRRETDLLINSLVLQQKGSQSARDAFGIAKDRIAAQLEKRQAELDNEGASVQKLDAGDLLRGWKSDKRKASLVIMALVEVSTESIARKEAEENTKRAEYERQRKQKKEEQRSNVAKADRGVLKTEQAMAARVTKSERRKEEVWQKDRRRKNEQRATKARKKLAALSKRARRPYMGELQSIVAMVATAENAPGIIEDKTAAIMECIEPCGPEPSKKERFRCRQATSYLGCMLTNFIMCNSQLYENKRYGRLIINGKAHHLFDSWADNVGISVLMCEATVDALMAKGLHYLNGVFRYTDSDR